MYARSTFNLNDICLLSLMDHEPDADIHGNIGYQMPALTPIRAAKHSGVLPTLGNGEYDWTGFVPFDEMLHAKNPREGFILAANNKAPPSNYKHLILNDLDWEFHYRAQRIRQMILEMSNTTKLSMDDIRRIQLDVKSYASSHSAVDTTFSPYFIQAYCSKTLNQY